MDQLAGRVLFAPVLQPADPLGEAILHGRTRLYSGSERLVLKPHARVMAFLAQGCAVTGRDTSDARTKLVFFVPGVQSDLGRYIVVTLLLADFWYRKGHQYKMPHAPANSRPLWKGDILLVTQRTSEAQRLIGQLRIGAVSLRDHWDIMTVSNRPPEPARFPRILLGNPGWFTERQTLTHIGAVVIDASHPRTLRLLERLMRDLRASLNLVIAPPLPAERLQRFFSEPAASVWLSDPETKGTLNEVLERAASFRYSIPVRKLWIVNDGDGVDKSLRMVHQHLMRAMQHVDSPKILMKPWMLYHRLRQLALPLAEVERVRAGKYRTLTLDEHLRIVERGAPDGDAHVQALWPRIVDGLRTTYRKLAAVFEPPKFWALAERLQQELARPTKKDPLRVVVGTQHEATIMTSMLNSVVDKWASAVADGQVSIMHINREAREAAIRNSPRTVLLGHRTGSTRHLDLYPSQVSEVIAYPYEASIEQAALRRHYRGLNQLRQPPARARVYKIAGLSCDDVSNASTKLPFHSPAFEVADVSNIGSTARSSVIIPDGRELPEIDEIYPEYDWTYDPPVLTTGTDNRTKIEKVRGVSARNEVTLVTIRVTFLDGSTVDFPEGHRVDLWYNDALVRTEARMLRPGHRVVLMVDDAYGNLFERLLELINERRNLQEIENVALWQTIKREALRRHEAIGQLYDELSAEGITVQYDAVKSWYREGEDEIIAPRDFSDFCILGKSSGLGLSKKLLEALFQNIQNERIIRRRAGRWLSNFLRQLAAGGGENVAGRAAKELGLGVTDFYDAIDIRTVDDVTRIEQGEYVP